MVNGLVAAWWEIAGLGDNEASQHVGGLPVYLAAQVHFG